MAAGPLVRAVGVERTFGSGPTAVRALRGVSLEIEGGRLTALKGRSGSGKTTLLNILGGLDRPNAGQVFFEEKELTRLPEAELTQIRLRNIGYVFQSFGLMPLLSARENVELPLRMAGVPHKERRERAERWLAYVGLEKRAKHRPYELSGGEQQRTALARTLAMQPRLILADEPTGELDTATSAQVLNLLKQVTRETGVAICLTTHDPAIMEMVDVVYSLVDGRLAREEQ
ncbi:MAG TPA: ABC transporter ATP-binding protein [Symbiobacteriaceae bacterium]|jgi:putative ABC transport system ATP-binding protein|nr:ABC transporter ATP-binding protein [Symbiobacteriaceae bacterium]